MSEKRETDKQLRLLNLGNELELSKFKKSFKMRRTLSLEEEITEENPLEKTPPNGHSSKKELLFDNRIGIITVEELAVIFRLAPQTIRKWISYGKIPHVRIGRRYFFQKRSLEKWLNQKEEPLWE